MTDIRRVIAPWPGDEERPFVQGGIETTGGRILWASGTTATSDSEAALTRNLTAQITESLDRTGEILIEAEYTWADVVRLNWYIKASHAEEFRATGFGTVGAYLATVGCKAPGVLTFVSELAVPDLLCEFEATAVRP